MAKATYVFAFILGVLVIYTWHQYTTGPDAAKPSYLFLLNGTVTDVQQKSDATVALSIQPAQVMQFTDRPYHLANTIGWADLESILIDMIHGQKNPPNATIVDANDKAIIVEIVDVTVPVTTEDVQPEVTYLPPQLTLKVLRGNFFPTDGAASPFVGQGISMTIDPEFLDASRRLRYLYNYKMLMAIQKLIKK